MTAQKTQDEVAISIKGVSKAFRLPHEKQNSLKGLALNIFKAKPTYEKQQVLRDISFDVKKGEFFGIVGRNGSGKSTLLKLISQIYTPDAGQITVNGKLTPFIELGVGFNPELTGRENVFLNGALLGFTRKEMEGMYDEIVSFAELERFMDQKLKNYSSGMQVRLAFSIAIRADTDILVLDEVLAVGDEAFQRKCKEYFTDVKKSKKTVVLVTHDMASVRKYCDRAVMIHQGEVVVIGSPEDVASEYSIENLAVSNSAEKSPKTTSVINDFKVELVSSRKLSQDEKVILRYSVASDEAIDAAVVMDLYNVNDGYYLYCFASPYRSFKPGRSEVFEVTLDISSFNDMDVVVHSSVKNMNNDLLAFSSEASSPNFMLRRTDYKRGVQQSGVIFKNGKNARWL